MRKKTEPLRTPSKAEPLLPPQKAEPLTPPSKTDLEILAVLWDTTQATCRDIYEVLMTKGVFPNGVAYTTVKTYLDRLIYKGYATARALADHRGTYLYTATVSRQEVRDHPDLLERIINALQLRPPELVQWFYQKDKLSQKDKAELVKMLDSIPDEVLPPE